MSVMDKIYGSFEYIVHDKQLLSALLLAFVLCAAVLVISFITRRLRKRGIKSTLWNVISFVLMIGLLFSFKLVLKKYDIDLPSKRYSNSEIHYDRSLALKAQEKFFTKPFLLIMKARVLTRKLLKKPALL